MVGPSLRSLAAQSPLPALERRMIWCHVLGVTPAWFIAHDDAIPSAAQVAAYQELEARRLAGEPMAYLLGQREFMGHRFAVTPHVLIPRPETEHLVELTLAELERRQAERSSQPLEVLDLGTGSGAMAISIALARPDVVVAATDVSTAALAVARGNARRLNATVEFFAGNWYHALPEGRDFDVIVSNPPYIAAFDEHLQQGDLRFEPRQALTDEGDGLQALACIIAGASARLRPGGALFVEHGWDQAATVAQYFRRAGLSQVFSQHDLAGIVRITGGFFTFFMDQS